MTRERDRRRDQAPRRLRAALRQAVRGHQEGPGAGPVHGREPVAAPLARRSPTAPRRPLARPRPPKDADAPNVRADDPRQPRARPASRTAEGSERLDVRQRSRPYAGDVHPGGRRARGRRGRRRADAGRRSRSARSTARSARRSSRTRPARRSAPRTSTCCACSAFAFDPQVTRRPRTTAYVEPPTRASRRRRRAPARPGPGAAGADERRPGDGRGAEEDRRRQPVHGLRRARHRDQDEADDGCVVDLSGVDVYDPTTGEVRSNDTDQIALWMIDTDYNEESFFVRHCYFTGGNDPYKRLKTRAQGRHRRGRLGDAVPRPCRARSPSPRPARSPSRSSTTTATRS